MATRNYSSVSPVASLSAGISDTDLTITVSSTGPWPNAPFTLILDYDDPDEEVVEVTSKNGTNNYFTITRGVDGTTARSHSAGAVVVHGVSARDFAEVNTFINTVPTISLQPTAPVSPSDGDVWIDSDGSVTAVNPSDYVTVDSVTAEGKGALLSSDGTDPVALGVGADGFTLTADSSEPTGLKWSAPSGGLDPFLLMGA